MTTINDISDLARILKEQPEWAETLRSLLLTQELLELPTKFAAFIQTTTEFMETTRQSFALVNQRLERLEGDVAELKTDVDQMNGRMDQMNGRMDNGFGANYEQKVANNLGSIAGQRLNVRRTRILKGPGVPRDRQLEELSEQAEEQNKVVADQVFECWRLDLIFTARQRTAPDEQYYAAEVSITIGDNDITRAAQRAATLSTLLERPVTPVVIGSRVDEIRERQAAESNVIVILEPHD